VSAIIDAADKLIGEKGYDVATMTEIASRSGSSIGAVYQYFPNKEELGKALRTRYADEMSADWTLLADSAGGIALPELARRIVALMTAFFDRHPAYFVLLEVPLTYRRDAEAREQLREQFAQLFMERAPQLGREEAALAANVALQIVKALAPLYGKADEAGRKLLAAEFTLALGAYFTTRLG
jgi:AcrR family transcriptional regulator